MNAIIKFFLSIKVTSSVFALLLVLSFIGSITLPYNLAFFSGIDDARLFTWLKENSDIKIIWWIYAIIASLAFLALSTIFCTVDGLIKKTDGKNILLKISPQVMHIGVLFIMLGHLVTAGIGYKKDIVIKKGEQAQINETIGLELEDAEIKTDKLGYDSDWEARLIWLENGKRVEKATLRPASPIYKGQIGVYFKSLGVEPEMFAQVRVSKDPGALWALLGGVLLSAGGLAFIYARFGAS